MRVIECKHFFRRYILNNLIDLRYYPVERVLTQLLKDKTTKKNIIFATDAYESHGPVFDKLSEITKTKLLGIDSMELQPRVLKSQAAQQQRTRKNAEVFTPSWICNKMNNHCDTEWFGRENVFNTEDGHSWKVKGGKIGFKDGKTWQEYVDSRRIEITCGEAPYIVSRYDTSTGETIPITRRIGILDRKLRVVNENAKDEETWLKWTIRAIQSVYGYEYQGDNLLIARINVLYTFTEYLEHKWKRKATDSELREVANIIAWNFWQMDGITNTIPFGVPEEREEQLDFFGSVANPEEKTIKETPVCKIYDWRSKESLLFTDLKKGK